MDQDATVRLQRQTLTASRRAFLLMRITHADIESGGELVTIEQRV